MASLFARHTRSCPLFEYRRFEEDAEGCSCQPTYVVSVPEGGKRRKLSVGKNRKIAERALRKLEVEIDEGSYRPQLNKRFEQWGDQWLGSLEKPKESTKDSYVSTIEWAKKAFGPKTVRTLTPSDVARMNTLMREASLSDSTRAKHLRVLGACLRSAVENGYAARNPVRELPRSEKPRPEKREAAFFTNEEIPRLFAELPEGMYRVLFEVALKTGMREGELAALTWGDVDLSESVIHVRQTCRRGRLSRPKNHEIRDVLLTDDVVELLGRWWGELGRPDNSRVVFPGEGKHGYLEISTVLRRELYPALKRAGIPREATEGRASGVKRTFHSLRHTFAKRALESGAEISWLQRHLGHSSITVTVDIYGHWEKAERRRQAQLLEGAFGI
jgi:integrase